MLRAAVCHLTLRVRNPGTEKECFARSKVEPRNEAKKNEVDWMVKKKFSLPN
jgi:hypothetical protein